MDIFGHLTHKWEQQLIINLLVFIVICSFCTRKKDRIGFNIYHFTKWERIYIDEDNRDIAICNSGLIRKEYYVLHFFKL